MELWQPGSQGQGGSPRAAGTLLSFLSLPWFSLHPSLRGPGEGVGGGLVLEERNSFNHLPSLLFSFPLFHVYLSYIIPVRTGKYLNCKYNFQAIISN